MICRCFGRQLDLGAAIAHAASATRTVIGAPDYDAYVAHLKASHPERDIPSRAVFVKLTTHRLKCC